MRELWVRVKPSLSEEERIKLIQKASDVSTGFIVDPDDVEMAKKTGAKTVISTSEKADIILVETLKDILRVKKRGKTACIHITVQSKDDEKKITSAAEASTEYIIAKFLDWKIIPLENLIARIHGKSRLITLASNAQEAKLALETLEIGADGILLETSDINEIMKIHEAIKAVKTRPAEIEAAERITLLPAEVAEVKPLGSGARVCIDTCDLMKEGEGLLVGCQSSGMFLIQAEVFETSFVATRPFRVNAGSIALYVLAPGGKTRYLSELKAGDEVLIADREGKSRTANICRVKIEWRPLILIEAECKGKRVKTILQNAETIRLVTEDGTRSVKDLSPGDKVLVHLEEGGRHFGVLVKEEKVIEL